MPPKTRSQSAKAAESDADDFYSSTLKGSGSLGDRFLGLVALLTLLATWFCGIFFPPMLAIFFWLRWKFAFGALLGGVVASYAVDFDQEPKFTRWILFMSHWFRHATMHVEKEVEEALGGPGSLWALHPHGLIPYSFVLNGAARFFAGAEKDFVPGMLRGKGYTPTGVAEPLLWYLPFIRTFLQLFGCVRPAARESFKALLRERVPFGLLPGGSEEIIILTKGRERIYLKKRKGFIKYSLQHGYTIVPGYAFSESDTYWTPPKPLLTKFRLDLLRRTKIIVPLVFGFFSPFVPLPVALDTVWGAPLKLPTIEQPTVEDIDLWHGRYVEAVRGVFERNKGRFGFGDRELEIL
ncbi:diacylglycerol acyltransferase-domain-containing protein [Hyaloraphidium curvatum]|nr:diacylglycerol acyltransferase-domain-containing protein [Hyaloraphidium curvatum]